MAPVPSKIRKPITYHKLIIMVEQTLFLMVSASGGKSLCDQILPLTRALDLRTAICSAVSICNIKEGIKVNVVTIVLEQEIYPSHLLRVTFLVLIVLGSNRYTSIH